MPVRLASLVVLVVSGCGGGRLEFVPDGGTARVDGDGCVGGAVFRLDVDAGRWDEYCVAEDAEGSCGPGWLTIHAPDDEALTFLRPCLPDCSTCEPSDCPDEGCLGVRHMNSRNVEAYGWSGDHYVRGTCGTGVECAERRCAQSGRYRARMCATEDLPGGGSWECAPLGDPVCAEVEFVLPTTGVVEGTVVQKDPE